MIFKEAATELLRDALIGRIPFVVLRGIDEFARIEGDIDILVPQSRAEQALIYVAEHAERNHWYIAGRSKIGYISQLCLVKRWGEDARHQAIKIDIWNGLSWAALGKDPWGLALFQALNVKGEIEIAGLSTLLQKFLYAGYLRERDKERIFTVTDRTSILEFAAANNIPLTRSDLEAGALSKTARWRLRAASAAVRIPNLPIWAIEVICRTLKYLILDSSVRGQVIVVSGADADRCDAVAQRFRGLVGCTGFTAPYVRYGLSACSHVRTLLGQTVVVNSGGMTQAGSRYSEKQAIWDPISVTLPNHRRQRVRSSSSCSRAIESDLDVLLEATTNQALHALLAKKES